MEDLILNKARELFFSCGLKAVSLDDIAKNAGVSKKTIYNSFANKDALVQHLVSDLLAYHSHSMQQCSKEANDAVQEVLLYGRLAFNTFAIIIPRFFYELEKSIPDVSTLVTEHREQVLVPFINQNLHRGLQAGQYRQELDIPFVSHIRLQQIVTAFDPTSFTNQILSSKKLMLQLTEFYLHGITTPKGKKLLYKYLNVNNEKQFSN